MPPPSNAGPAGHDAATIRFMFPTITSVFVPTSTNMMTSSVGGISIEIKSAATSAPTWLAIKGRLTTIAFGFARIPNRRVFSTRAVVERIPSRYSCSIVDLYGF